MKKGMCVSRSVYAKLLNEKHRLLRDIKIMAGEYSPQRVFTVERWRKKFRQEKELNEMIRKVAREYGVKEGLFKNQMPNKGEYSFETGV
jgi:hypothetical protein